MNEKIGWMGAILALQLLLVAALLLGRGEPAEASRERLLAFEPAEVAGLVIEDAQGAEVALRREDDRWVIAGAASAAEQTPADGAKVDALLESLAELRAGWPVAKSGAVQSRFEVAEEAFQRRVVLSGEGDAPVAELYLGTSPGFRRVHARLADEDDVYSVDLAHYQLPASPSEWLDTALLQAEGPVSGVARDGAWRLTRSEGAWQLDDGPADAERAEELASRFGAIRVTARLPDDAPAPPERALFRVTDARGEYRLRVFHEPDADSYQLSSDRCPGRFEVPGYVVEPLLVERAALEPQVAAQT